MQERVVAVAAAAVACQRENAADAGATGKTGAGTGGRRPTLLPRRGRGAVRVAVAVRHHLLPCEGMQRKEPPVGAGAVPAAIAAGMLLRRLCEAAAGKALAEAMVLVLVLLLRSRGRRPGGVG